jgi:hypothetical protein
MQFYSNTDTGVRKADQDIIQGRLKDRDEEDDSFHSNGRQPVRGVNGLRSGSEQPEQFTAEPAKRPEFTERAKLGQWPELNRLAEFAEHGSDWQPAERQPAPKPVHPRRHPRHHRHAEQPAEQWQLEPAEQHLEPAEQRHRLVQFDGFDGFYRLDGLDDDRRPVGQPVGHDHERRYVYGLERHDGHEQPPLAPSRAQTLRPARQAKA